VKAPPLFSGLSADEQREILAAARPRQLKPREWLAEQGQPADIFALVQVGHLKLSQVSAAGAETLVRFVGPGDCFGAIALVPASRYPLSAIAVDACRALTWPRQVSGGLSHRIPQLKSNIFEEITRRMTGVLTMAQELATERVPQRLARALLRLAEHGGTVTPGGIEISHPVTRQELAELTGTTLFTVSRLMSQWETAGLLRTGRGAVAILDPDGLEAAASAENE
jgi:CRP/FNR family transcriptional regulator, nitrogen oxide reductase regulator